MSVTWGVIPSQPKELGFREWLNDANVEIPQEEGRYPTLDEMKEVLRSFEGYSYLHHQYSETSHQFSMGTTDTEENAAILGSIKEGGQFSFHFFDSATKESTMFKIIKRLSSICGPMVIYESITATPVLIDEKSEIEESLADWQARYRDLLSNSSVGLDN